MKKKLILSLILCIMSAAIWAGFAHYGAAPWWVVLGEVVDESGKPIAGAKVIARLGDAAASDVVLTNENGKFFVHVFVPLWSVCKGASPSLNTINAGFRENWGYYQKWSWGLNFSNLKITLHKGPPETPFVEDLRSKR